ncbi:MAG: DUF4263 domain-containing protein [Candidatus Marsarchaeota archaeon]|nr:DUF4263 domain-containing protein [Candidatus Marsarchaeota archaeon]
MSATIKKNVLSFKKIARHNRRDEIPVGRGRKKSAASGFREFQALLDDAQREQELQQWLKDRLWVLGAEYLDSQPIDNAFDIIEIKKPDAKLFLQEMMVKP